MSKPIALTVLLFAFSTMFSYGQLKLGAKTGISLTTIRYYEPWSPTDAEFKVGSHTGAVAQLNLNENLFAKLELLYSQKGARFPASQFDSKGRLDLHYISMPLLLGYKVVPKLAFYAGPEASYLVSATSRFGTRKTNLKRFFNIYQDFDLGLALGSSYAITEEFTVDLRFIHGLTYLMNYEAVTATGLPAGTIREGRNLAFQLGAIYFFKL